MFLRRGHGKAAEAAGGQGILHPLQEGDVIRSSADLTQGIETSSDSTLPDGVQQMENGDLYVGDPSNMPEGTVVMGGGDAPAGGPDGGPGGGQ